MECRICKKELNSRGVKLHLKQHFSGNELYNEYFNMLFSENELNLIIIMYEDGYSFSDIMKKFNKGYTSKIYKTFLEYKGVSLRSNSESKKTKIYIKKYTNTIKNKYDVENISQCNSIKEKKKKTFLKNYGYENNFCNENIRKKGHDNINYSEIWKKNKKKLFEKYGVKNMSQIPHVRKKMSLIGKERVKNMMLTEDDLNSFWKKIKFSSSLELRIHKILNENKINYTHNIWLHGYSVDLYLKKYNVVIEVNGDYWHGNPNKYNASDVLYHRRGNPVTAQKIWNKDLKKKNKFMLQDTPIIYIWETTMKKMSDDELLKHIIHKIKEYEN